MKILENQHLKRVGISGAKIVNFHCTFQKNLLQQKLNPIFCIEFLFNTIANSVDGCNIYIEQKYLRKECRCFRVYNQ